MSLEGFDQNSPANVARENIKVVVRFSERRRCRCIGSVDELTSRGRAVPIRLPLL